MAMPSMTGKKQTHSLDATEDYDALYAAKKKKSKASRKKEKRVVQG
jgi:hypothetical protein